MIKVQPNFNMKIYVEMTRNIQTLKLNSNRYRNN